MGIITTAFTALEGVDLLTDENTLPHWSQGAMFWHKQFLSAYILMQNDKIWDRNAVMTICIQKHCILCLNM